MNSAVYSHSRFERLPGQVPETHFPVYVKSHIFLRKNFFQKKENCEICRSIIMLLNEGKGGIQDMSCRGRVVAAGTILFASLLPIAHFTIRFPF